MERVRFPVIYSRHDGRFVFWVAKDVEETSPLAHVWDNPCVDIHNMNTHPKFNIAPENEWLEDCIPLER